MRHIDQYSHLNESDKFEVELDLEDVVKKVMPMNYGMHRFLSAFVKIYFADDGGELSSGIMEELAWGIADLLEKGYF